MDRDKICYKDIYVFLLEKTQAKIFGIEIFGKSFSNFLALVSRALDISRKLQCQILKYSLLQVE